MSHPDAEQYMTDAFAARAVRREARLAELADALLTVGNLLEHGDVLEVNHDSKSVAVQRLHDTLCACGERLGFFRFVLEPKSNRYIHVMCLELADAGYEPGQPQGGLF